MTYAERIHSKLTQAFSPCDITLTDESHKHAGHSGADPAGETHFALTIASDAFDGMNRVQRHQAIYKVLESEMNERVHALRMRVLTFDEVDS